MKPVVKTIKGWVFIHPDGHIETDYFHAKKWDDKGRRVSREAWHRSYRPECAMVRADLVVRYPG